MKTKKPNDQFARLYTFAMNKLQEARAPAYWDTVYRVMMQFGNFTNGVWNGHLGAIQAELRRRRIRKHDNTIRHALRRFAELGILQRDGEVNQHTRRLNFVLRRGESQTMTQLAEQMSILIGKLLNGSLQRRKSAPVVKPSCQRYQMTPSESFISNNSPVNNSRTAAEERAKLREMRKGYLLPLRTA